MIDALKGKKPKKPKKVDASLLPLSSNSLKQQFLFHVQDNVMKYFQGMFAECEEEKKPNYRKQEGIEAVFRCFQTKLKTLKTVDPNTLFEELKLSEIILYDMLKIIIIAECMIIGCVRTREQDIEINIPTIQEFVHQMLLNMATSLFGLPTVITVLPGETEQQVVWKRERMREFMQRALEDAIRRHLPVKSILDKYGSRFHKKSVVTSGRSASATPAPAPAAAEAEAEESEESDPEGEGEGREDAEAAAKAES